MKTPLRAVFLLGPTAAGKTDLALRLCEKFNGEVISVDSVQIYKGMDIGSAKPSAEVLRRYPHHLIDIVEPDKAYSAAQFCDDARKLVQSINARGGLPILTGGTMFYFHAFENGLDELPSGDPDVRREIEELVAKEGIRALYNRLEKVDAKTARKLNPNDTQRVQRAWEIYLLAEKPLGEIVENTGVAQRPQQSSHGAMRVCKLVLNWSDRKALHRRIEKRFDGMLRNGLQDEVCRLMLRGDLTPQFPAVRAVGYRQMWRYLCGEVTWDFMREKSIAESRGLVKRQCTWIRSMQNLHHLIADEMSPDEIENAAVERIGRILSVCG